MAEIDASMAEQVARSFRLRVLLEIRGRTYDGCALIAGYTDRNHVLLNVFTEVNACVKASRHNIKAAIVGGDIEHDVGIVTRKLRQLRSEHGCAGDPRNQQPHAADGFVAKAGEFVQDILDIVKRGAQAREEPLSRFRRRNAARRAREKTHS